MSEPFEQSTISIPMEVMDNIYVALCDAFERLPEGGMNIKRCINYLEEARGYKPPVGYILGREQKMGGE